MAVYAAESKGWFKDAGLKVTIEPGSGSTVAAQLVGTGKSQMGFAFADAVLTAAAAGVPLQGVAVTQSKNPV